MADYRLKIKIGEHEFEADGPVDAVKSQFEAFKELITSLTAQKQTNPSATESQSEPSLTSQYVSNPQLDKIFQANGRVISLTVPPNSDVDAVLLILYGQRYYRKNENPTGSEIMDGMELSGYRTSRIDRILANLSNEGAVIITGAHRGKRYRLTHMGVSRAEGTMKEALARLP